MSARILVQGRLVGVEDFLLAPPADRDNRAFEARLTWLSQLGETLPRALLTHLQLPPLLLGSSGGGQFLTILPDQDRAAQAGEFLARANTVLSQATGGKVRVAWSATENLGDWTVVRKRLAEGMRGNLRPDVTGENFFEPFATADAGGDTIPRNLRDAAAIAFSFDFPALIAPVTPETDAAIPRWDLAGHVSTNSISMARHAARNGDVPAADKKYLAQLVATRTGLSQAEAEKRVDEVLAQEKAAELKARQAADTARKAASYASIFTALAMLIGAFIACAAAALGGQLRDQHD